MRQRCGGRSSLGRRMGPPAARAKGRRNGRARGPTSARRGPPLSPVRVGAVTTRDSRALGVAESAKNDLAPSHWEWVVCICRPLAPIGPRAA
jgi:hypothetical protein